MEILINNTQNDVPVKLPPLKKLARQVLELEKVDPAAELSISLVTKDQIQALNHQYRKINAPTDVLAFSFGEKEAGVSPKETGLPLVLGDVVISPVVALEQSKEYQTLLEGEIQLLLTHGILHLLGYDHGQPGEAEIMRSRENEILKLLTGKGV